MIQTNFNVLYGTCSIFLALNVASKTRNAVNGTQKREKIRVFNFSNERIEQNFSCHENRVPKIQQWPVSTKLNMYLSVLTAFCDVVVSLFCYIIIP